MLFPKSTLTYESTKNPQNLMDDIILYCKQRKTYRCTPTLPPLDQTYHGFSLMNLLEFGTRLTFIDGRITEHNGGSTVMVTIRASQIILGFLYLLIGAIAVFSVVLFVRHGIAPVLLAVALFLLFFAGQYHYAYRNDCEGVRKMLDFIS